MTAADTAPLSQLEESIGVTFSDPALLRTAMAHRSWCAENDEPESNERLEFLGDAVLSIVVTDYAFRHFPDLPEGTLSEVRARVVNAEVLADVARSIELGRYLFLGKGEAAAGGREKQSILADALEALIAAVYLEADFETVAQLVLDWTEALIIEAAEGPGDRDYKTRLQELAARAGWSRPRYDVRGEGPDHSKRFFATVYVDDKPVGDGEGRSKKQAEQAAAWMAHRELVPTRDERNDDAGAA